MDSSNQNLVELQRAICERAKTTPAYLLPVDRIGIGRDFDPAGKPINGLRHPAHGNMCGWYIWSGEMLSEDSDYFNVICYEHIVANAWDWVQYLALPEGWRFLAAPGYEDMWFDQALFEI